MFEPGHLRNHPRGDLRLALHPAWPNTKATMKRYDKTPSIRAFLLRTALWGTALALTAPLAQAVVSYDAASQTSGVGFSALDGVAKVTIASAQGDDFCSGSLVGGGVYVLTAAHCFTMNHAPAAPAAAVTVGFKQDTVTVGASAVYVDPAWKGSVGSVGDLALIKLSSPITSIASYAPEYANMLGFRVLIAGYGLTGTGAGGVNPAAWTGALFYGFNEYDDRNPATSPLNTGNYFAYYDYDFDGPKGLGNVFGSTGLGTLEAAAAAGDSGGPNLVSINGTWMLAGVTSWGSDGNIRFGSYDAATSLAYTPNAVWLESYLANAVPEPQAWVLLAAGLGIFGALRRRRR